VSDLTGSVPPASRRVPFYPIQAAVAVAAIGASVAAVVAIVRRLVRRRWIVRLADVGSSGRILAGRWGVAKR
jgi:hypothetical protein